MAPAVAAALQIFDDVVKAPGFQPAALGGVKPRRKPALHEAAAKSLVASVGAERVFGRVACAAIGRAFDQISAPIPFRAPSRVVLERAALKEQEIPAAH